MQLNSTPVRPHNAEAVLDEVEQTLVSARDERQKSGGILMLAFWILLLVLALGALNLFLIFFRP